MRRAAGRLKSLASSLEAKVFVYFWRLVFMAQVSQRVEWALSTPCSRLWGFRQARPLKLLGPREGDFLARASRPFVCSLPSSASVWPGGRGWLVVALWPADWPPRAQSLLSRPRTLLLAQLNNSTQLQAI